MEIEKSYKMLNESYKQKLVYNLGGEAGFFSEYNNMILSMLYCLKYKIKFELYSSNANFAINKGWEDYFMPFCNESKESDHYILNPRQPQISQTFKKKLKVHFFKKRTGTKFLTSDLWDKFHNREFENEIFDFPELGIKGKTIEACKTLINITWRYNKQTELEIKAIASNIHLPKNYVGFHIRAGDKINEFKIIDVGEYFKKAEENTLIRNAFILTDDYQIIEEIKENYGYWNISSLCEENEKGYHLSEFLLLDSQCKRDRIIKLFASIDILANSDLFIGTFSSNPGMYMGMRMGIYNVIGVDLPNWVIW